MSPNNLRRRTLQRASPLFSPPRLPKRRALVHTAADSRKGLPDESSAYDNQKNKRAGAGAGLHVAAAPLCAARRPGARARRADPDARPSRRASDLPARADADAARAGNADTDAIAADSDADARRVSDTDARADADAA